MPVGRGIVIEIIGDEKSYLRSAENTIATNTKLDTSFKQLALNAKLSADAQVKSALKAQEAQRVQIARLGQIAGDPKRSAREQAIALGLQADAQARLNRSLGVTTRTTSSFSGAAKEGEKDLSKLTRGALAGSGLFAAMGRSLAFASGGFLAFAVGAQLIRGSVDAARELDVAERQSARQLKTTGLAWGDYQKRIESNLLAESHLSGFTRVDLLTSFTSLERVTGSVGSALKDTALAANVARGRHIALSAAANALAKAEGGSFSALRRLNIIVPQGATKMQALAFVQQKYAGQAKAGTTAQDRFNATWVDTEEIIGKALLPTVNDLLTSFGDWLDKQNQSGKLQANVNTLLRDGAEAAHVLAGAIGVVDKVTGSFANTIKLLIYFQLAKIITTSWVPALEKLAIKWGIVAGAATAAGEAEAAAAGGAVGGGGRRGIGGITSNLITGLLAGSSLKSILARRGGTSGVVSRVSASLGGGAAGETALGAEAGLSATGVGALAVAAIFAADALDSLAAKAAGPQSGVSKGFDAFTGFLTGGLAGNAKFSPLHSIFGALIHGQPPFKSAIQSTFPSTRPAPPPQIPSYLLHPPFVPKFLQFPGLTPGQMGPFGTARPMTQFWKSFQLNFAEQLAQAQAQLTRSSADDVASARKIVARIRRLLDEGRLHGNALLQALGLEANALSTIWSAEDAAAQKRADAAQKAKARIQQQIENSLDPAKLELALSQAELSGNTKAIVAAYRALIAAVRKAMRTEKLSVQQRITAIQNIIAWEQAMKSAQQQSDVQFTVPAKLALDLARDQALGRNTTKDLLRIKAAILKFIAHHRKNIAALTDAYNQLAAINQQLGSSAQSALGLFKQASTKALTAGLGLSDDQRRRLRQRLAGLGPGGTVSGSGTGAAGFAIDPNTGRPIAAGHHGRAGSGRRTLSADEVLRELDKLAKRPIRVIVDLDGRVIADSTTRHQQRRRSRNSSQRRGPNAGN